MGACAVIGCKNRTDRFGQKGRNKATGFHKFPRKPELKKIWIKFTGRGEDWEPKESSIICTDHFHPDDVNNTYFAGPRLRDREKAIPRLKPGKDASAENTQHLVTPNTYQIPIFAIIPNPNSRSSTIKHNDGSLNTNLLHQIQNQILLQNNGQNNTLESTSTSEKESEVIAPDDDSMVCEDPEEPTVHPTYIIKVAPSNDSSSNYPILKEAISKKLSSSGGTKKDLTTFKSTLKNPKTSNLTQKNAATGELSSSDSTQKDPLSEDQTTIDAMNTSTDYEAESRTYNDKPFEFESLNASSGKDSFDEFNPDLSIVKEEPMLDSYSNSTYKKFKPSEADRCASPLPGPSTSQDSHEVESQHDSDETLNQFTKYLVTLIKALPRHKAFMLQQKIIKLALDANIENENERN